MTNRYFQPRKEQIIETLVAQTLLTKEEFHNDELLIALKEFANSMLEIVIDKEHASHLTIRNLSRYIRNQAEAVGLSDDLDVTYAAEQLDKLSKRIHILESGIKGEARAKRAMFGIDTPNRILKNVEINVDGEPYEIDFVVINKSGIYVIESKHFSRDMLIDENGNLVPVTPYGNEQCVKKIRMQMANQRAAVRSTLAEAYGDMPCITENIKSVLLCTGDGKITDVCEKELILDCDVIASYLNSNESKLCLSRNEINTLADTIEKASCPRKYNANYDYARVAHAFATAIAKIEFASEITYEENVSDSIEDNQPEEKKNNVGWKIASGAAVAAVVLSAGWKLFKKFI